jgi:hypothetical protein
MGLELAGVHVYERVKGTTNQMRLVRTNPYVRIMGDKFVAPIFVQGGRFYSEGGAEVEEFPPNFQEELAKLSPEIKAEVGLKDPPTVVDDTTPESKVVATWTCPECHEAMPAKKKGLHVARHRKVERAGSV